MADDQFQATANWWDSASRNVRFESGASQSSSNLTTIPNFTWHHPPDMDHDLKPSSSMVDSPSSTHPNLHIIMGLGLSSHPMDWNQPPNNLLREEKVASDGRFRAMFQENLSSSGTNFQQESGMGLSQVEWREKLLFSAESSSNDQYSSGDSIVTTSQGLPCSFHTESSYASSSPSILQGLLGPEASSSSFDTNRSLSFPYGNLNSNGNDKLMASWPKVPQFLRPSPPKQPHHGNNQLHFTNNATFWNASDPHAAIKEARSTFFPSLQPPFPTPSFDEQSKNICGGRESVGKKSGSEGAAKRARNEASSPLPAFKVRKEKMGDRITALQQLVSPFGKTDTASVLSEAIEYIKFLHEQVTVLSNPYMKSGDPIQHQLSSGKSKEPEALKQDLKSRGLCLVPVSSTYPVTHETTVDFWMPTFGPTFR